MRDKLLVTPVYDYSKPVSVQWGGISFQPSVGGWEVLHYEITWVKDETHVKLGNLPYPLDYNALFELRRNAE